jgi:ribosomal protein S12 methylthiotransferase accessory factor
MIDNPKPVFGISIPAAVEAWLEGGMVTVNAGFDLAVERGHLLTARREGRHLLSIRTATDEVFIGPRWIPGVPSACAGCAEVRLRLATGHPLLGRSDVNASGPRGWPAVLSVLGEVGLNHLVGHPLGSGEMLTVGLSQTRRRRVVRSMACPLCGPQMAPPGAAEPPVAMVWQTRPSAEKVPLRGAGSAAVRDQEWRRLVDHRVGPVVHVRRDSRAPFAMSSAVLPASRSEGHGRHVNFDQARRVAILEAYERLGGFPHQSEVVRDLPYDEAGDLAVDPARLGRYSPAQLAHPNSRVREYRPDEPMDWAYGYRLGDGQACLLPADVAFYGYHYPLPSGDRRDRYFAESSSGCALGNSLEEAALHGLLELIERDSFLLAWCRRVPLPAITVASVSDPTSRMLLATIESRGFEVHLLVTTYDLAVPTVWALAVNRLRDAVPATLSAAGSGAVPGEAVRAALWELTQLAAHPVDWDIASVEPLVADPSQVDSLEDHVHLYAMPDMRDRVTEVLGGQAVALDEAFAGWPEQLCQAAGGDVRGALDHVAGLCREAGLDEAFVVDQSTTEHVDLGLRVARVVVPGMLPMCFGSPQQRLGGLPRRERALAAIGRGPAHDAGDDALLHDPHPFP